MLAANGRATRGLRTASIVNVPLNTALKHSRTMALKPARWLIVILTVPRIDITSAIHYTEPLLMVIFKKQPAP